MAVEEGQERRLRLEAQRREAVGGDPQRGERLRIGSGSDHHRRDRATRLRRQQGIAHQSNDLRIDRRLDGRQGHHRFQRGAIADQRLELRQQRFLVRPRKRAHIDLRLAAAGDHVHLLADVDHRGGDRVAQHGGQRAAHDRVLDACLQRREGGCLVSLIQGVDHPIQAQRGEEAPHDGREPGRPGCLRHQADRFGDLDGGVVGVGHRAVAGGPAGAHPRPDDSLLRDLDGVDPPAADRHRVAADLVECRGGGPAIAGKEEVRALRHPVSRTVRPARLFVGDRRKDQVAAPLTAGPLERQHDAQLHGDHVLHIDCAAPPDHAVDQLSAERVARPRLAVDRDDIHVRQEDQRRLGVGHRRGQPGEARTTPGHRFEHLGRDSRRRQDFRAVRRRRGLAAGRVTPCGSI